MNEEKGGQMKELDFDELHQAVSKIMDQSGKAKSKHEPIKSAVKTAARPALKVAERNTPKAPTPPAPSERGETITVRRPVARVAPKKRGMAMDVIQAPKETPVAPPSSRPARTAPTLQPTRAVRPEPPSPRVSSMPASAPSTQPLAPATDEVSEDTLASINMQSDGAPHHQLMVEPHPSVTSVFPDPLDVHGFNEAPKEQAPSSVAEPIPTLKPALEQQPKNTWDPLLDETPPPVEEESVLSVPDAPEVSSTPFVYAKVEKRPLGAFAAATPPSVSEAPTVQSVPSEASVAPTIPVSDDDESHTAQSSQSAIAEAPTSELASEPNPDPVSSIETLRGTSIPQQYQTSQKEADTHDRPVFDTKNYHTPIQTAAGGHRATGSHAGIILTIILIILLIASGIAAYYIATGGIDLRTLF